MKPNMRQAILGLIVYRIARFAVRRALEKKGGSMATKKKTAIFAAIGAAVGALLFWRKRKARQVEV
jgi:hypothetical protein